MILGGSRLAECGRRRFGVGVIFSGLLLATCVAQADPRALEQRTERLERWVEDYEPGTAEGMVIGGALRFQYAYRDWDQGSRERFGDLDFEVFRINVTGRQGRMSFSGEYRWYEYMDTVHHGWIGYDFSERLTGRFGIQQEPFGNLPYNSHSFFFSSGFYLGIEDSYSLGGTLFWEDGPWEIAGALFKNEGTPGSGNQRYSYDLVTVDEDEGDDGHFQRQTNQVNLRVARTFHHSTEASTQAGVSARVGQMFNTETRDTGEHLAAAVHLDGNYGRWNLMLQAARIEFDPELAENEQEDFVNLGAFAGNSPVPLENTVYTANLARKFPVHAGPLDQITLYSNYSIITDKEPDFEDTHMNVFGASISAGRAFVYADLVTASNQPFLGGQIAGDERGNNTRFNLNIGYYY